MKINLQGMFKINKNFSFPLVLLHKKSKDNICLLRREHHVWQTTKNHSEFYAHVFYIYQRNAASRKNVTLYNEKSTSHWPLTTFTRCPHLDKYSLLTCQNMMFLTTNSEPSLNKINVSPVYVHTVILIWTSAHYHQDLTADN